MDYQQLVSFTRKQKADVTAGFIKSPPDAHRFGLGGIAEKRRPTGWTINLLSGETADPNPMASLTIYLFKTKVLLEILKQTVPKTTALNSADIFPSLVHQYRSSDISFRILGLYRTLDNIGRLI